MIQKKLLKLFVINLIFLIFLIISGYFFVHHYYFYIERLIGFYAILGIASSFIIIVLTNLLKKIGLKKKENYYDD
ncbi:MAG: hypothetical protein N2202_08320 [Proteobacteria bacterium]|nr:hypothetical protein [Pseudomonadota bacterium]